MKKYICSICGYIYDEANGNVEKGVSSGTKWQDVPNDWVCPLCGASKNEFSEELEQTTSKVNTKELSDQDLGELKDLNFSELSALFSNLSKGCEKQYLSQESTLFMELSNYYLAKTKKNEVNNFDELNKLIKTDLEKNYPVAFNVCSDKKDRGALRALTWGEKVTKIVKSLIEKYKKEGSEIIKNKNVYVCEICGFIYTGQQPPDVCPVCKVPHFKINIVKGGK